MDKDIPAMNSPLEALYSFTILKYKYYCQINQQNPFCDVVLSFSSNVVA